MGSSPSSEMKNTHYAVLMFSGDPCDEHEDEDLRGQPPSMQMLACGPEEFCWAAIDRWVDVHPLREWESVEVVHRDPIVVDDGLRASGIYLEGLRRDRSV